MQRRQSPRVKAKASRDSPSTSPSTSKGSLVDNTMSAVSTQTAAALRTEMDFDPTLNFFGKPHTITLLVLMLAVFLYVALYVTESADNLRNTKIGLAAATAVFLLIGLLMFNDGPFVRPHPAFWRVILACSTAYQVWLVYLLFQNVDDARQLLKAWDPTLGIRLPERSYAADCSLTWSNISSQLDEFVVAHVLGWVVKALMMRDYWICWILSILFELLEYSLQHQLPNFAECWWDHWILDVLLCNWAGLYIGMKLCSYFDIQTYSWGGIRQIPTYSGKVKRAVQQFTPYSWTRFEWEPRKSFKHYFTVVMVITLFLQAEMNAFYLKYLLWVPPRNPLNTYRLIYFAFVGAPSMREAYQYLTDPNTKRLGAHAWLGIANVVTESLICVKFGKNAFHVPTPWQVTLFWTIFLTCIIAYGIRLLLQDLKAPGKKSGNKK